MPRQTMEGLYKRKDRKEWYCRFYEGGKLRRVSTGETDYHKARIFYKKIHTNTQHHKRTDGITVNDVLNIYHDEHGVFLKGQKAYNGGRRIILKFYDGIEWDELGRQGSPHNIKKYCSERIKQGVKAATINREIVILSAAANVAIEEGLKIKNYCEGKKLRVPKVKENWLTISQAKRLLEAAKESNTGYTTSTHIYHFCVIALGTGMRTSEILGLTSQDVSIHKKEIWLHETKSGEPHMIPMNEAVERTINELLERCSCKGVQHLFFNERTGKQLQTIYPQFRNACKRAGLTVSNKTLGIKGLRVHDTRHTVATWLMQSGAPLEKVQDLLNHSDVRTTQRYAHHSPRGRRDTVNKIPQIE